MEEALVKVDPAVYGPFFVRDQNAYKGEGDTPFEQVQNAYKKVETFTPRADRSHEEDGRGIAALERHALKSRTRGAPPGRCRRSDADEKGSIKMNRREFHRHAPSARLPPCW